MLRIRLGLCTRNFHQKHKNMHIPGAHFSSSEVNQINKIHRRLIYGKKFLLRHFFGQFLNRKNSSFIRASLLRIFY
jgi:hypothetical protein